MSLALCAKPTFNRATVRDNIIYPSIPFGQRKRYSGCIDSTKCCQYTPIICTESRKNRVEATPLNCVAYSLLLGPTTLLFSRKRQETGVANGVTNLSLAARKGGVASIDCADRQAAGVQGDQIARARSTGELDLAVAGAV